MRSRNEAGVITFGVNIFVCWIRMSATRKPGSSFGVLGWDNTDLAGSSDAVQDIAIQRDGTIVAVGRHLRFGRSYKSMSAGPLRSGTALQSPMSRKHRRQGPATQIENGDSIKGDIAVLWSGRQDLNLRSLAP